MAVEKKVPITKKPGGGGKGISLLKKIFFFAASLSRSIKLARSFGANSAARNGKVVVVALVRSVGRKGMNHQHQTKLYQFLKVI